MTCLASQNGYKPLINGLKCIRLPGRSTVFIKRRKFENRFRDAKNWAPAAKRSGESGRVRPDLSLCVTRQEEETK